MTITLDRLNKINDYLFEIPKSFRKQMRVPALIYATQEMLEQIFKDRTLEQLVNVTALAGIQIQALVMPDAHEGYGFPIGGVAAIKYPEGIVSPGGIGYDINCGVRLLKSNLDLASVGSQIKKLAEELYRTIPSGVGRGGKFKLDQENLDKILKEGVRALVKKGYGEKEDLVCIESGGSLGTADPAKVSKRAKQRGLDQMGTLGAGNHFVEIDQIIEVYNKEAADIFGLFKDQVVILIHTGSRGLGHQVATDYIRIMMRAMPKYGISVPDRELVCVPCSSREGQDYLKAMAAAANFAWANRQMITYLAREAWLKVLGKKGGSLAILYDVAHNIAKIEEHLVAGKLTKVIVHRKGATRAFPPGHSQVPKQYREVGQPVIIPGSMGTASYVLHGTPEAMNQTFGTVCHGAGRLMSRRAALNQIKSEKLRAELQRQGIYIQASSIRGLAEEAPAAYKDIDDVVEVVDKAGLARAVAKLKPLAVIKG